MKLDDIRDMETEPFDEDVLEEVYYRQYESSAMMPDGFAVLILQYFMKFDERYGTQLTKDVYIEQVLPCSMDDVDQQLWFENIDLLAGKAMNESGWYIEWINTEDEEFRVALEEKGDSEEAFHAAFKEFLDKYYGDCFIKSCFLQEEKEIRETVRCLEDGEVGILWNSSLERYKKYRRQNAEVVAAICPEEDYYISILQEAAWRPFIISYVQKTAVCEDRTYGVIVLGCDGYNCCSSNDIDPNWIPKVIKLGWMLQLALEKIECYEDAKQSKKAA